MKIVREIRLLDVGTFSQSAEWEALRADALAAIRSSDWPVGSGQFTLYPESGKKSGEGNGVKPIKDNVIRLLTRGKPHHTVLMRERAVARTNGLLFDEWIAEVPWPVGEGEAATRGRVGRMDAAFQLVDGVVCLEWETGNISSSHRALNKMALGLLRGVIKAGMLIVPSREMYQFLTDRVGNIAELEPYFDLWRSVPIKDGILDIIVVEHDALSTDVPRIPKGTDGRAAR